MDIELDNDWKKSVGFPINYDSGQSSDDDFDIKDVVMRNPRTTRYLLEDGGDGSEADLLGTTPPRSRIRDKEKRRNYMDTGISLQRLIKEKKDAVDNAHNLVESPVSERLRKRASLKLIRSKERDFKQDQSQQNKADSLPSPNPVPAVPTLFLSQVESCSRFMSLSSRPKCRAPSDKEAEAEPWRSGDELPASRVNFHKTFSMLINMGNVEKGCRRTISREEQVWQNELKDLIWLELQAKIAGRTLAQQDAYLCAQRKVVPTVIKNICEYRFVNTDPCRRLARQQDSRGSHEDLTDDHVTGPDTDLDEDEVAFGCLTFDCVMCCEAVGRAMREVGTLLDSFYNAVSLYPSSKAMTVDHPLIATPHFKNRLKAMCLWFNTALNMRLKMVAVRRLLRSIRLKSRRKQRASLDSDISRQSSECHRSCKVQFNLCGDNPTRTPTDSSNSDSSYIKEEDERQEGGEESNKEEGGEESNKEEGGEAKQVEAEKHEKNEGAEENRGVEEKKQSAEEKNEGTDEKKVAEDVVGEGPRLLEREDEVDSGVESMRHTGQTTPEIVVDSRYSTTDTSSSQDSGYASHGIELTCGGELDPYDVGPLDELTQLRLLGKTPVSLYREHHQEILKTQGVRRCMMFINKMRKYVLQKVHLTLEKPDSVEIEPDLEEAPVEVFHDAKEEEQKNNVQEEDESRNEELKRYGCWSEESRAMRLPSYRSHFLLLSSISMEATHDYLSLRLETKPDAPSCLTVKQLMHELKEGLDIASDVRLDFVRNLRCALAGRAAGPAAPDLLLLVRTFDTTVETVLKLYLSYLTTMSEKEAMPRGALQAEWRFTARLARRIKCAQHLAPVTFSTIVCNQLNRLLKSFREKFSQLKTEGDKEDHDPAKFSSHSVYAVCRAAQAIFASEREHTLQAAQWARALAARLARAPPPAYLKERTDIFNGLMSIRDFIVTQVEFILKQSASTFTFDGGLPDSVITRVRELLLQTCKLGFELHKELHKFAMEPFKLEEERVSRRARPTSLQPPPAAARAPRRRRPDTMLVHESYNPILGDLGIHKELHRFVNEPLAARSPPAPPRGPPPRPPRGKFVRTDSVIEDYEGTGFDDRLFDNMNQFGDNQTQASIEVLLTGLQAPAEQRVELRAAEPACAERKWAERVARAVIHFAQCWMTFVVQRCDKGRGLRPRWASQGLEFLMLACDPCNTKHLSEEEFETLKQLMDNCISHVIGSRPAAAEGAAPTPSPRPRHRLHSPFPGNGGCREMPTPPTPPSEPDPVLCFNGPDSNVFAFPAHRRRVLTAIAQLDESRETALRAARSVGRVVTAPVSSYDPKLRQLTFKWQRGLKIGAGTFGKVYTVVNTESGQLLAMKELSIGANDRRAYQRAANELRVLEGVIHPHLVRYYGCELHREEMLIFMELCVEGSLEALVATSGALAEPTVRRYTRQLLSAVLALHARSIAHRDIKSGNIFLTNEGHCLKLGDFGCAVKIRANTTAPNELQGFVGTQAYMAPEVFMNSSGHGRAADIWSLGCVVTEMASGKHPFIEYDSNYQIMFRVGMGARPAIAATLSAEGREFCERCLTHEPEQRPRAHELMMHTFLMVNSDDDCKCEPAYLIT